MLFASASLSNEIISLNFLSGYSDKAEVYYKRHKVEIFVMWLVLFSCESRFNGLTITNACTSIPWAQLHLFSLQTDYSLVAFMHFFVCVLFSFFCNLLIFMILFFFCLLSFFSSFFFFCISIWICPSYLLFLPLKTTTKTNNLLLFSSRLYLFYLLYFPLIYFVFFFSFNSSSPLLPPCRLS